MIKKCHKSYLEFVYDLFKELKNHEITLAYEGEMNHQVMLSFTEQVVGKMSMHSEPVNLQNLVYHVLVESLQNISKHAFQNDEKSGKELNHGVLLVSNNPWLYQVTTGNIIEKDKICDLKDFLEKINSLERNDLDNLYKKQLKEGSLSRKGGAGLGFIDLKRKTGEALDFHFIPISSTHSLFLLTITINRNT